MHVQQTGFGMPKNPVTLAEEAKEHIEAAIDALDSLVNSAKPKTQEAEEKLFLIADLKTEIEKAYYVYGNDLIEIGGV